MSNRDALPTVDIVYRGQFGGDGLNLRMDTDDAAGATLHGHFTRYDSWYEINSWLEGRFMERTAMGSCAKTIKENRNSMVVAFDHGYDLHVGDAPLGPIVELREDDEGPYYEVPLLDTDYNRDRILPMLQGRTIDGRNLGSVLGASFRFRVVKDEWNNDPGKSAHNPEGIPERTITEMRVFEFGPVVYPANPDATAGVRGLTDHFFERALARSGRSGRASEALAPVLTQEAAPSTSDVDPDEPREHSTVTPARSAAAVRMAVALANHKGHTP